MWRVPNVQNASYVQQSVLMASALNDLVLARQGNGVISGCSVGPQSALTLAVTAGEVQFNGVQRVSVNAGTVTIAANVSTTLDRHDIVQVSNSGVKSVVQGTLTAEPIEPELTGTTVKLASIFVPRQTSTITNAMISDRRVQVLTPYSVYEFAVANGIYTGPEGGFVDFLKGAPGGAGPPGPSPKVLNVGEVIPNGLAVGTIILRRRT